LSFPIAQEGLLGFPSATGGFTCLRMFLHISFQQSTVSQVLNGAFGISVNTDKAVGIDPILDLVDYYLHDGFDLNQPTEEPVRQVYDIRTARRVRGADRRIEFNMANSAGSAGTVAVTAHFRLLIKPD